MTIRRFGDAVTPESVQRAQEMIRTREERSAIERLVAPSNPQGELGVPFVPLVVSSTDLANSSAVKEHAIHGYGLVYRRDGSTPGVPLVLLGNGNSRVVLLPGDRADFEFSELRFQLPQAQDLQLLPGQFAGPTDLKLPSLWFAQLVVLTTKDADFEPGELEDARIARPGSLTAAEITDTSTSWFLCPVNTTMDPGTTTPNLNVDGVKRLRVFLDVSRGGTTATSLTAVPYFRPRGRSGAYVQLVDRVQNITIVAGNANSLICFEIDVAGMNGEMAIDYQNVAPAPSGIFMCAQSVNT